MMRKILLMIGWGSGVGTGTGIGVMGLGVWRALGLVSESSLVVGFGV